jgi:hypothetical protein
MAGERYIAISNTAFGFAANPEVSVTIGGRLLTPVAVDSVVQLYDSGVRSDAMAHITITSQDSRDVDVVTF